MTEWQNLLIAPQVKCLEHISLLTNDAKMPGGKSKMSADKLKVQVKYLTQGGGEEVGLPPGLPTRGSAVLTALLTS